MHRPPIRFLPLVLFTAVILIVAAGLHHHHAHRPAPAVNWVGRPAPVTYLPSVRNDAALADAHFKSTAWHGRPYILHFFASWCPDCRAEQDGLLTLAAAHIPIVGILFQDRPNSATAWLQANGDPYALIATDPGGKAATDWGVTSIPQSYIVDGDGIVRWQSDGPIPPDIAENIIMPLWEELRTDLPAH